jgi:hypothetical protein
MGPLQPPVRKLNKHLNFPAFSLTVSRGGKLKDRRPLLFWSDLNEVRPFSSRLRDESMLRGDYSEMVKCDYIRKSPGITAVFGSGSTGGKAGIIGHLIRRGSPGERPPEGLLRRWE